MFGATRSRLTPHSGAPHPRRGHRENRPGPRCAARSTPTRLRPPSSLPQTGDARQGPPSPGRDPRLAGLPPLFDHRRPLFDHGRHPWWAGVYGGVQTGCPRAKCAPRAPRPLPASAGAVEGRGPSRQARRRAVPRSPESQRPRSLSPGAPSARAGGGARVCAAPPPGPSGRPRLSVANAHRWRQLQVEPEASGGSGAGASPRTEAGGGPRGHSAPAAGMPRSARDSQDAEGGRQAGAGAGPGLA